MRDLLGALNRDVHTGGHRGRDRDGTDVVPLDGGGLGGSHLIDEGRGVFNELIFFEAHLADAGVDIAALVGAVLDLTGTELTDGGGHIGVGSNHSARLGGGHEAAGTEL